MKKLVLLLPLLLIFSCSVQKRKYQKGYYVDWLSKNRELSQQLVNERVNKKPQNDKKPGDTDDRKVANVVAELRKEPQYIRELVKKMDSDSCDEIVFRDGSEIKAKVFEISSTSVKYKRCGLEEGPTYVAKRSEVFMIKYANGTREVFKDESPASQPNVSRPSENSQPNSNPYPRANTVTHPMAFASFICGLLALLSFVFSAVIPATGLLSLILACCATRFGKKSLREIEADSSRFSGKMLAITGRVLGWIVLSIFILLAVIIVAAIIILLAM